MQKIKSSDFQFDAACRIRFVVGENGHATRTKSQCALILAAIKSTRLVANANRPEASAFPVSPIPHPSYARHVKPTTIPLATTQPPVIIHRGHVDHLADWRDYILPVRLRFTCSTLISRFYCKSKLKINSMQGSHWNLPPSQSHNTPISAGPCEHSSLFKFWIDHDG